MMSAANVTTSGSVSAQPRPCCMWNLNPELVRGRVADVQGSPR
jgi:hypothetical protein